MTAQTSSPPGARLRHRRRPLGIELAERDDAVAALERGRRPLLGDEHRGAALAREPLDEVEERLRAAGVELRGGLVEQQQLRLERERRGEADPLQLAARELGDVPLGEVLRADRSERGVGARQDLLARRAEVLEPEGDLGLDARHHHLVLGVLEDGRHRPGQVGRVRAPGVVPADDDASRKAAAVEVRHQPGEGPHEGRLPRARAPEQEDDLARLQLEVDAVERRPRGARVRERQPLGAR